MNATTATIIPAVGMPVVLDMVGATGTIVAVYPAGSLDIRWNRNGKIAQHSPSIVYRLLAA